MQTFWAHVKECCKVPFLYKRLFQRAVNSNELNKVNTSCNRLSLKMHQLVSLQFSGHTGGQDVKHLGDPIVELLLFFAGKPVKPAFFFFLNVMLVFYILYLCLYCQISVGKVMLKNGLFYRSNNGDVME